MEIIDGADIQYDGIRTLKCKAIIEEGDPTPFNFLDHFDESKAHELALGCSRFVTKTVLEWRDEPVEKMLPLDGVSQVYDFVSNKLGMEPYGSLFYVENAPGVKGKNSGYTTYHNLQSVVMRDRILQDFTGTAFDGTIGDSLNLMRVRGVATHELAHLAGAQDTVYFAVDENNPRITTCIVAAGSTLENRPYHNKGEYFEEGLGTLTGSMYLIRGEETNLIGTTPYKSPDGTLLHLPNRINFMGHHEYAFCGWGIERLVYLEPKVWDILLASRRYGATSQIIRNALRTCINGTVPGLFEHIDTTDIKNLDATMATTERIDHAAKRV